MTAIEHTAWTPLTGVDPELVALAERCLHADGGLPLAADPGFLARRWAADGVVTFALRADDGGLLAAGAARPAKAGAAFTGLVDPSVRGRGVGARLLDHGLATASSMPAIGVGRSPEVSLVGAGRSSEASAVGASGSPDAPAVGESRSPGVTVEIESLTSEADELFVSRGLRCDFAENVMRLDLAATALPPLTWPDGATVSTWTEATSQRFFTTYDAAFRDRPGFPGDPAEVWISENEEDEDFLPDCSVLLTLPGLGDAGFVVAARDWIVQVGVVPPARRRGLAGALLVEALTRLRAAGSDQAWLTVNRNNPGAEALYQRLGFVGRGRRARYVG